MECSQIRKDLVGSWSTEFGGQDRTMYSLPRRCHRKRRSEVKEEILKSKSILSLEPFGPGLSGNKPVRENWGNPQETNPL